MADRAICDVCDISIEPHDHFVVRIDVFADPETPPIDTDQMSVNGANDSIENVMKQLNSMSADELQDGVHRRFEYRLCAACQKKFLANPLGLPRCRVCGKN